MIDIIKEKKAYIEIQKHKMNPYLFDSQSLQTTVILNIKNKR